MGARIKDCPLYHVCPHMYLGWKKFILLCFWCENERVFVLLWACCILKEEFCHVDVVLVTFKRGHGHEHRFLLTIVCAILKMKLHEVCVLINPSGPCQCLIHEDSVKNILLGRNTVLSIFNDFHLSETYYVVFSCMIVFRSIFNIWHGHPLPYLHGDKLKIHEELISIWIMNSASLNSKYIVNNVNIFNDVHVVYSHYMENTRINNVSFKYLWDEEYFLHIVLGV